MQSKEDLLIVAARIVAGLDEQKSVLAGVLPLVQIFAGESVGVIPAEAGRARREGVTSVTAARDERSSFFHGAVHLRGQKEAMPVNHFAVGGLVANIDSDRTAFLQAKQWAGYLAVVGNGLDASAR